jgi:hypothetical protein
MLAAAGLKEDIPMTQTTGVNSLTSAAAAPVPARAGSPTAAHAFGSVLAQMAPSTPERQGQGVAAEAALPLGEGAASAAAASANMAVMSISPALRVITDGGMNVSVQSLQAFAKSQGLSEDALHSLALLSAQDATKASGVPVDQMLSGDAVLRARGFAGLEGALGLAVVPSVAAGEVKGAGVGMLGVQPEAEMGVDLSGAMASILGRPASAELVGGASSVAVGERALAAGPSVPPFGVAAAQASLPSGVPSTQLSAPAGVGSVQVGFHNGVPSTQLSTPAGVGSVQAGFHNGVSSTQAVVVQSAQADAVSLASVLTSGLSFRSDSAAGKGSVVNMSTEGAAPVVVAAPAAAAMLQMPQALAMLRAKPEGLKGQAWQQEVILDGVRDEDVSKLLSDGWTSSAPSSAQGLTTPAAPAVTANALPMPTDGQSLGAWHKQQFDELSDKLGQAVAQRIQAQIQRGHWNMSLNLRPHELGNVEVQLGMRGHDLSASFQAAQALTRDLLQDSMPRLREMLASAGIDVASADVGGQMGRGAGGNPTPARPMVGGGSATAQNEIAPVVVRSKSPSSDTGLDLWA